MLDLDVKKLLEERLGVDPENKDPFSPKVILHIGAGQKHCIAFSRDLSLRKNSALICSPKGSGTFSRIISGMRLNIVLLMTRLEGLFASAKKPGELIRNFHLADAVLLFYNTPPEIVKDIVEELGRRFVGSLMITGYVHTNSLFGTPGAGQELSLKTPEIAEKTGQLSPDAPKRDKKNGGGRFKSKHKIRL